MILSGESTDPSSAPGPANAAALMKPFWRELQSVIVSLKFKSLRERMKTKNFYALFLFLLAAGTTLWLVMVPSPNFHTIVSETHKQISNIKNIPSNIRNSNTEQLEVDPKYLELLGLYDLATNVDEADSKTILATDPVIVVPVTSDAFTLAKSFLMSVMKLMPGKFVRFYDLGLSGKENFQLRKACNSTKTNCQLKVFPFSKYPSHVKSNDIKSYVPICIQESLNEFKAIIWSDPREHFLTSDLGAVIASARQTGILAWSIEDSASSITYPKQFTYFDTKPDSYYFNRAVKTNHLILFNTNFVKSKIMLPWIKCALVEECVSPTGSQNNGYCFQRKPRYLYSGCHFYEQSALNVILGKVFEEQPYLSFEKVFGDVMFNKTSASPVMEEFGENKFT